MLERIAKHIDGRKVGGFNGVLRNLIPTTQKQLHYPQSQQEFLKAKVVLLPVSDDLKFLNNITDYSGNLLFHLEKDLIHAFELKLGKENLRNGKFPNGFSGYFNLL
jgi:phosphatidate phosphatase APP1